MGIFYVATSDGKPLLVGLMKTHIITLIMRWQNPNHDGRTEDEKHRWRTSR